MCTGNVIELTVIAESFGESDLLENVGFACAIALRIALGWFGDAQETGVVEKNSGAL